MFGRICLAIELAKTQNKEKVPAKDQREISLCFRKAREDHYRRTQSETNYWLNLQGDAMTHPTWEILNQCWETEKKKK